MNRIEIEQAAVTAAMPFAGAREPRGCRGVLAQARRVADRHRGARTPEAANARAWLAAVQRWLDEAGIAY